MTTDESRISIPADNDDRVVLGGFGITWKIAGEETGGRFSVVHHPLAPRALAAPLHRHANEDEYSYVIEGTLGALLGDEVVTPDSSRFWPADAYALDVSPPSFDKQYLRDWLDASGWDHTPPGPLLPPDVVRGTRDRYLEAYRRITGQPLERWMRECAA